VSRVGHVPRRPATCVAAPIALCAIVGLALAGGATRLAAQYPDVPPPVRCRPAGDVAPPLDPGGTRPIRAIAIVPFQSTLDPADSANTALAEVFAGRLRVRLAAFAPVELWAPGRWPRLRSASQVMAAGAAAHARFLLLGRIDPGPAGIVVSVRLAETAHGLDVWNATYGGVLSEMHAYETGIAHAVAAHLTPAGERAVAPQPTRSGAAYLHYLLGAVELESSARGAAQRAMTEFSTAVHLDSAFGGAWAGLAASAAEQLQREGTASAGADSATLTIAEHAAVRALARQPMASESWLARAAVDEIREPRDYGGVLSEYRRAIELDPWAAGPHVRYATALLELGSYEAADEQLRIALRAAPGSPAALITLAGARLRQRRYREACRALDLAVESDPRAGEAYALRAFVRLRLHDIRSAWVDAETGLRLGAWLTAEVAAIATHAAAHDTAAAREQLAALLVENPGGLRRPTIREGYYLALGFAALGRDDDAVDLLNRIRPRGVGLRYVLADPAFEHLRGRARLDQLANALRGAVAASF